MSLGRSWLVGAAALAVVGSLGLWSKRSPQQRPLARNAPFVAFDLEQAAYIGLPARPSAAEQRAAKTLQHALALASGKAPAFFAIKMGDAARQPGGIHLAGVTRDEHAKLEERTTLRVQEGNVSIESYPSDGIDAAVGWFLEQKLGAHWFMPGKWGEFIPRRDELSLMAGVESFIPSYVSRNFTSGNGGPEESEWYYRNRLRGWFKHGHAMSDLFRPEDLRKSPELASTVNGQKVFPDSKSDGNWQPNIAAPGAANHAAEILLQRKEFSSSVSLNDSIRFDQSSETQAKLGGEHWFRKRPDFSNYYFGFVNDVAKRVPGRYLGAYAYDWTENTPNFRIQPNVVPYLTADRSEWFDPAFAAEDQALIKRWVASGAEVVGIYDYYYGAPYLVPRPTLYAVERAIPFAYEAGVRAFYAEVYPNWGLDGPKVWLAAQLLWNAKANPKELLSVYYRDFWAEAAGPMKEFYALCDQQWLNQPKPGYWLKYYNDEHQYLLFPKEVRKQLRALIAQADEKANTFTLKKRVALVSDAFSVTEAFCDFCEARDELSRATQAISVDATRLKMLLYSYKEARLRMEHTYADVKKRQPMAIRAELALFYTRNDPALKAEWLLGQLPAPTGEELLKDAALQQTQLGTIGGFFSLEWVKQGPWRGHGEPHQTRTIRIDSKAGKSELFFTGCKTETFFQVVQAQLGQRYVARVKVRGKVSPGNMTFLLLNFQDATGAVTGYGTVDRLPVGEYDHEIELLTWAKAPANAAFVGLGVRVLNQVNEDEAVFTDLSLQALKP